MALDFKNPVDLTTAVNLAVVKEPFLLKTFFPTPKSAGADTVALEFLNSVDKRAKFVLDGQEARVIGKNSSRVVTVKIPTTYERKIFSKQELTQFTPQIPQMRDMQEQSRIVDVFIKREIEDLKNRVIIRREDMAAQGLFTGMISEVQDNIEFSLNFGYVDGQNKITLSNDKKWNGGTKCDILSDIRLAKKKASKKGKRIDTAIVNPEIADIMLSNSLLKADLHNNNFRIGSIDQTKYGETVDADYIGTLDNVAFFSYDREYVNDAGSTVSMVPTDKVLFGATNNDNQVFYAPITRIDGNGLTIVSNGEMFLDSYIIKKRSLEWELEQSSLPAILNPDAFVVMTVI